jgi:hypothetical protein
LSFQLRWAKNSPEDDCGMNGVSLCLHLNGGNSSEPMEEIRVNQKQDLYQLAYWVLSTTLLASLYFLGSETTTWLPLWRRIRSQTKIDLIPHSPAALQGFSEGSPKDIIQWIKTMLTNKQYNNNTCTLL